jgi:hypothetical protein
LEYADSLPLDFEQRAVGAATRSFEQNLSDVTAHMFCFGRRGEAVRIVGKQFHHAFESFHPAGGSAWRTHRKPTYDCLNDNLKVHGLLVLRDVGQIKPLPNVGDDLRGRHELPTVGLGKRLSQNRCTLGQVVEIRMKYAPFVAHLFRRTSRPAVRKPLGDKEVNLVEFVCDRGAMEILRSVGLILNYTTLASPSRIPVQPSTERLAYSA